MKSTREELDRFGGAPAVVSALNECLDELTRISSQPEEVRRMIHGPAVPNEECMYAGALHKTANRVPVKDKDQYLSKPLCEPISKDLWRTK